MVQIAIAEPDCRSLPDIRGECSDFKTVEANYLVVGIDNFSKAASQQRRPVANHNNRTI